MTILEQVNVLKTSYLAGGTALVLQIGHRYSDDFGWFTTKKFDEDNVISILAESIPNFKLIRKDEMTILALLGEAKFSLFYLPCPLLAETIEFNGLNLASIKDIAAMKINAILGRGSKKYFVDLYCIINITKLFTLREILELYQQKYANASTDILNVLQALNYFVDAEIGQELNMLIPLDWEDVKKLFISETKKIRRF